MGRVDDATSLLENGPPHWAAPCPTPWPGRKKQVRAELAAFRARIPKYTVAICALGYVKPQFFDRIVALLLECGVREKITFARRADHYAGAVQSFREQCWAMLRKSPSVVSIVRSCRRQSCVSSASIVPI